MDKFSAIIEKVKNLSLDEKEELSELLQKYLIEARRDEISANLVKAKKEKNKKYTSEIKKLKTQLR